MLFLLCCAAAVVVVLFGWGLFFFLCVFVCLFGGEGGEARSCLI